MGGSSSQDQTNNQQRIQAQRRQAIQNQNRIDREIKQTNELIRIFTLQKKQKEEQLKRIRQKNYSHLQILPNPQNSSILRSSSQQIKSKAISQIIELQNEIPYIAGQSNYIIAGGPGTGKTSLINYFFGTSLPVRVGGIRATNQAQKVYKLKNGIAIIDTSGQIDFEFMAQTLKMFKSGSKIFLFYNGSIIESQIIIKVLFSLNSNAIQLVKSKCDQFEEGLGQLLEEEILVDTAILLSWGIEPKRKIFTASSRATMDSFNNRNLYSLMTNLTN